MDSTAPAAGTLALANFSDTGSSGSDFISQDKTFDLSLSGQESGSTVVYQVSTNGGGTWTTTSAAQSNLADGNYQFRAQVTDVVGNTSTGNVILVTVDSTAPAAGTLALANFSDTGSSGSDFISQDKTLRSEPVRAGERLDGRLRGLDQRRRHLDHDISGTEQPCRRQLPVPRAGHGRRGQHLNRQRRLGHGG